MLKRLIFAISTLLVTTMAMTASHGAGIPDEQWDLITSLSTQDQTSLVGLKIAGPFNPISYPSVLTGDMKGQYNPKDVLVCQSENDSICSKALHINYVSFLPPCDSQVSTNCIDGVSAVKADGTEIPGQHTEDFPVQGPNDYAGDPARNLPAGGRPSVWKISGVSNGGGTDSYLLRFETRGNADLNQKFHSYSINVSLFPIAVSTGNFIKGYVSDANHVPPDCLTNYHTGCGEIAFQHPGPNEIQTSACASFDTGRCALRQAFPSGYRFKVRARLGDSPTGWFHGRLFDPAVSLKSSSDGVSLTIEANPVKVPAYGGLSKQNDLTPDLRSYYDSNRFNTSIGNLNLDVASPYQQNIFSLYAMWTKVLADKASATQSEWSFRTLELNGQNNPCFSDPSKLVGIVSTNAMIYSGGAPAFNQSEGSLDYKVGAPHFASNGDVFKGSYDLQLRSDVARCLYGFSKAPIKATVSVANENGDSNVATTSVTEDPKTGWMHMSASNFEFSNPTVKVKMTQDAPAPSASQNPSTASTGGSTSSKAQAKATITCVKGKLIKTVSGSKPTCPSGYKRR